MFTRLILCLIIPLFSAQASFLAEPNHRILDDTIRYLESQDQNMTAEFGRAASTFLNTEGWFYNLTTQSIPPRFMEFVTTKEDGVDVKLIHEVFKSIFSSKLSDTDIENLTHSIIAKNPLATREILERTDYFEELHATVESRHQSELTFSASEDPKQKLELFKHYNDPVIVFGKDLGTFKVEYNSWRHATRDLADQDIIDWALPLLAPSTSREELIATSKSLLQSQKLKSALAILSKVSLSLSLEETNNLLGPLRSILHGWYGTAPEVDLIPVMQLILSQNPMSGSFYAEFEAMINRTYPNSQLLTEFRKFKLTPKNISTTLELAKFPKNVECKAYAIRKNKYRVPYLRVTPLGVMTFNNASTTEAFSVHATAQTHWSERIDNVDISYDLTLTYNLTQDPRESSKVVPELKYEAHTRRKQNVMSLADDMKTEMPGYQMAQLAEYELPDMSLLVSGNYVFTKSKSKNLYALNVLCSNEAKYFQVAEQMYMTVADQLQKEFVESLNLPRNN